MFAGEGIYSFMMAFWIIKATNYKFVRIYEFLEVLKFLRIKTTNYKFVRIYKLRMGS